MVTKILFKNKRAIGVQLSREGVVSEVFADAEIILSAGSIQSPQILQLSGIGPGKLLKNFEIDVVSNSNGVGKNLQDHYQMRTIVRMRSKKSLNNQIRNPFSLIKMGLDWAINGKGHSLWEQVSWRGNANKVCP